MSEPMTMLLRDLPGPTGSRAGRANEITLPCATRGSPARIHVDAPGHAGGRRCSGQPLVAVLGVAYLAEALVQALRAVRHSVA